MRRGIWFFFIISQLWVGTTLLHASQTAVVVAPDDDGKTTIWVSGADTTVTIPDIAAQLGAQADLLQAQAEGIWLLKANLVVETAVTLTISGQTGVGELRLRSDNSGFVYLRTNDGTLHVENTAVTSWDEAAAGPDLVVEDGRAYLLARGAAIMNFHNSNIGYLGWSDGESYGVSWRDVNDEAAPDVLRSRVTGDVTGTTFHHNYYGIYTHQASHMIFRENVFHSNIRYGFDPHDYTHDVIVEDNVAFGNGSHGFIISRGCFNFTFRRNVAYNNHDPGDNLAHGFMLDPGSPTSSVPQAPSHNSLLEDNEAFGNEGYGLRVRGSHENLIRNNNFHENLQGIVLDSSSFTNTVQSNTIYNNLVNGIYLRGSADNNQVLGNVVGNNQNNGIYVKSDGNLVADNLVVRNDKAGIAILPESDSTTEFVANNTLRNNVVTESARDGFELKGMINSLVEGNTSEENGRHGFYLTNGAHENLLLQNTARTNAEHGIRANGEAAYHNQWSANSVYNNGSGGIATTSGANHGVARPQIDSTYGRFITGTAVPYSTVEIFSDWEDEGQFFAGRTAADANGRFVFFQPYGWQGTVATAVAITETGDASAFSHPVPILGQVIYLPIGKR